MTATNKYLAMSEWVSDQETTKAGPIEAKAFLDGVLERVGVETKESAGAGGPQKAAGEWSP